MNAKYLFLIGILFLIALTAVSAQDNSTISADDNGLNTIEMGENTLSAVDEEIMSAGSENKLEKTSYYDADDDEFYDDDTVVSHDVVKYYGDTDTKFHIRVYDNDYNPEGGVDVDFGKWGAKKYTRTTNSNGLVSFPINYGVGKHVVISYIMCEDGESYFTTKNVVNVKSTIPTKTLSKHITQKYKKFQIKFLDTKGKPLKYTKVKIKVAGKTYKKRTNSKGIAKIRISSFKLGKHKITAYNPVSKEKRKITVYITKKIKSNSVSFKIKVDKGYTVKKLKTGDVLLACANSYDRQHPQGASIGTMIDAGQEGQHSTKLLKAKIWFKNKYTGKVITQVKGTSYKGYNIEHVDWINGYKPFKAKVWYTHR